jgi:hypothetical protein
LVDTRVIDEAILAPLMNYSFLPEEKHFVKRTGQIRELIKSVTIFNVGAV